MPLQLIAAGKRLTDLREGAFMSEPALWVLLIDAVAGALMWLLILQGFFSIILPDNSRLPLLAWLQRTTAPVSFICQYLTPPFIVGRLHAFIAAFWLFILRFYVLGAMIGYEVTGFSDLPLEKFLTSLVFGFF